MSTAARLAAGAVLLAACNSGPWPPPAAPAPPDPDTASGVAPVDASVDPREAVLAGLERDLAATLAWESERSQPTELQLARWRELEARAESTDYAPYARARIAALEREAAARLDSGESSYTAVCRLCLRDRWDEGLALLDAIVDHYPGTKAAARAAEHATALAQYRDRLAGAKLALVIGRVGTAAAWQPEPGGPCRLAAAQAVGMSGADGKPDWDRMIFSAPGQSAVTYAFAIPTPPPRTYLVVSHYSSFSGLQYSPITIVINGRVRVGRYNPIRIDHDRYTAWDVTDWITPGENTLAIRFERDALSNYWLWSLALTDVSPEPVLHLRD